jgi:8-oxo-dGTP pyrophosphatase MutT (NUDIX family)
MAGYVGSSLWAIRQKMGTEQILFPGVVALILNDKDEVLLGWREAFKGWSIFGGSMEVGEGMIETLYREVAEETGCEVASAVFFGLMSADRHKVVYPHGDITQQVSGLFVVRLGKGDVAMDEEHTHFAWYKLDRIPVDATTHTKDVVHMYQEFCRTGAAQIE